MTRSSSGFSDSNTEAEDEEEDLWYEFTDSFNPSNTTSGILFLRYENSCESPKIAFCDIHFEPVDQETVSICSSSNVDEITSFSGASSPISSYSFPNRGDVGVNSSTRSSTCSLLEDQEDANNDGVGYELTDFLTLIENKEVSPTVKSTSSITDCETGCNTPLLSSAPLVVVKPDEEEKDSFYKLYSERMKWFDLLHQERTCGLNAFLAKKEYKGGEKRIIKSLKSDFEMVYVAQSCLSWEALYYQYRKLDSLITSYAETTYISSPYGVALCSSTLVNKFQRFQILLERYMEDERSEKGKRYWNFVQKRSSLNCLLQVPYISENMDAYKERKNEGLPIRATDVLKTVEKCMKTFKTFIELDEKKPWWRARIRFSWNHSPLEDPRDFNLLHKLTRTLRQKEMRIKDLYGKQRCWLRRRVKIMEDVQKKEMMFAMIELKLVSRVLMMSVISTSQLQWCQQKLDNIEISHGRITRSTTSCSGLLLFPPS